MNSYVFEFLRKFLAALYIENVHEIPYSGRKYNAGVKALQEYLSVTIAEDDYDMISDIFVKTPVQEEYTQLEDILMHLNGDIIKFAGIDNPYWRVLTIKMAPFYANHLLESKSELAITREQYTMAANKFCQAAGVM